jgi:glycosyltransferase involved in cell wall biosynthesis
MNPTVSVVIPSFNRGDLIEFTLDSVACQSFQDWECLIVDDASTDHTLEVIAKWESNDPRFKGVKNIRSKGAQGARNTGLMMARGEFVLFVDSDDLLHERKIELHMKEFEKNPQLDMNYACDVFFSRVPGDSDRLWNIPSEADTISRFLHDDVPFHTQSPIWRMSSIRKYGMSWDENLTCWQDWDFNLRAIIRGMQYTALPQVLGYIRNHDSNRISNSPSKKTYKSMLRSVKSVRLELMQRGLFVNDYKNACNIFLLQVLNALFKQKNRNIEMIYAYYDLIVFIMRLNRRISLRLTLKSFYYLLFSFETMHGWTLSYLKQKYCIMRTIESSWAKLTIHEARIVQYPQNQ